MDKISNEAKSEFTTNLKVWLADLTHTRQIITSDVMPAAIGSIATYAEAHVTFSHPIRLFKYPEKLAQALENEMPDIMGFSNYIWNSRLAYKFSEVIKKYNPQAVIVFGGPNYPTIQKEQEDFLRKRSLIDFYVVKEGESAFLELLKSLICQGGSAGMVKSGAFISSVHWIREDGSAAISHEAPRIKDLSIIPSPYLTGKLDDFFDGKLMPILQTNRGCPFACTFCVEGVDYYNKVYRNSAEKTLAEIDYIGKKMLKDYPKDGRRDVYISDSNFAMYRDDLATCEALGRAMEKYGWPQYVHTTTGKNNKERVLESAKLLKGALRLSGSVQSLDKEVLKNIKRSNISEEQILDLAIRASEMNANSYSEIILCLPGDTKEGHFRSVKTIVDSGFNYVLTWQLMLLPGSEMCTVESRKKYQMVTKYRVLPRCYGYFKVRNDVVSAAEIEEACVANATMPFEDYLACRKLHLVLALFYNDTIMSALVKLLKSFQISPFSWIEKMALSDVTGRLSEVFESFIRETRDELWDDFDRLAEFSDQPETIDRFIRGELGNNVLYFHRSMALVNYTSELVDFAGVAFKEVLKDNARLDEKTASFVDDVLLYTKCRLKNIFLNRAEPVANLFRFDIPAFEKNAAVEGDVVKYEFNKPVMFQFVLDPQQEETVERYLKMYGESMIGISRILQKLYVNKLYRKAVRNSEKISENSEKFVISGLQDSLG